MTEYVLVVCAVQIYFTIITIIIYLSLLLVKEVAASVV
jgi:hypothetical protein